MFLTIPYSNFSAIHAAFNKEIDQSSRQAYLVEKATEHPWQFIVLLTATLSGMHRNKKWEYELFTGQKYSFPYGMYKTSFTFIKWSRIMF